MTPITAAPTAARRSHATVTTARFLLPVLVAVLVASASTAALATLIQGALVTGGGMAVLVVVFSAATAVLAVALGVVFRLFGCRSCWTAGTVIALVDLVVYMALFLAGTQGVSNLLLRPDVAIVTVALASGAASAVAFRGRWRVLGVAGVLGLFWLALTPVLVAL